MNIVYNIVVPVITSILGGLIGGLFTFLGVKLTIKNDNELKKQEIRERNKEKNKEIISNRPEFKVVSNKKTVKHEMEIYVLPYISPKLQTEEEIIFDYDNLNLGEDFWDCKETIICNSGKRAIETGFLQLEYKSGVNIYSKYEFYSWEQMPWAKNYYSDKLLLPGWIYPNECVKLKIYYPKNIKQLQNIKLNCYMSDEDDNDWYQDVVNLKANGNRSTHVSPDEYVMHYRDDYYKWFIYDHMYYSKDIKKCFNTIGFEKTLQQRREKLWKQEDENKKFKLAINNGDKLLRS